MWDILRLSKRLAELEAEQEEQRTRIRSWQKQIGDLSDEIEDLRRVVRRAHARHAVDARDGVSPGSKTAEQKLLAELLGGDVVAVQQPLNEGGAP